MIARPRQHAGLAAEVMLGGPDAQIDAATFMMT
jgi:hypothetical protein